jgi:cellulose synthase operon protein C
MKRKKLNIRLVAFGICGMLLLATGVHFLHAIQVKKSTRALQLQAHQAESRGDLLKAEEFLGRYLALDPSNVDELCRYAAILESFTNDGDAQRRAVGVYGRVIRLAPKRGDIRRRMVSIEIQRNQYSDALAHLRVLAKSSPRDAELKELEGVCEENTGQLRTAAILYRESLAIDPTKIKVYTRLAELLRVKLGDEDQADRVMDARADKDGLVMANPRSAAAYLARADYRERYRVPGIKYASDVAYALKLAPDNEDVLLAATRVARDKGDLATARKHLETGVRKHPTVAAFYRTAADLEQTGGSLAAAVVWLQRGLDAVSLDRAEERANLRVNMADLLIQSDKKEAAAEAIAKLKSEPIRPEVMEFLDACLLVANSKWSAGARALSRVHSALAAAEFKEMAKRALILLGRCHERLGNTDQRLDAYRAAVAIDLYADPLWVTARMGYAASLVAMDKIDEALDEYRLILQRDIGAGLAMSRLQIYRSLRHPDQHGAWEQVGKTLDAVELRISNFADAGRAATEVTVLRAESLAAQGRLAPARALLEAALTKDANQVELWVALANVVGRQDTPTATFAVLDKAQQQLGERIELTRARIAHWTRRGGDEGARALMTLEQKQAHGSLSPDALEALWRDLAASYAYLGKRREAERLWRKLGEVQPDDLSVRLALFDLAILDADLPAAGECRDQIRRIEGDDGSLWRFAQAMLLVARVSQSPGDRPSLAEARDQLERVALARPSWSRVPLALAQIDEVQNSPEAAIRDYLQAVLVLGERDPAVIRRVAQLLSERERFTEANLVLNKLRDDHIPLSGELQRLGAEVAFRNQDYGSALEQAERVVSEKSDDYRDLLWLGRLRWAAGRSAEPLFRRAVAIADSTPETWISLVVFQVGTGRKADALETLKKAERVLPRDKATLSLAQGYEAVGDSRRAAELYDRALGAQPTDLRVIRSLATFHLRGGRVAEAEPYLKRIIDQGGATTEAAWARRILASTMAIGGDRRRSLKALEVLGLSDEEGSRSPGREAATPDDLRTKAKILAIVPSRAQRREAMAILEGLIDRRVASPDDIFLLVQLQESVGDWSQARQRMLELLGMRGGETPQTLAYFVRTLMSHGQVEETRGYLDRLEKLAPGEPGTIEIKARVLQASERGDEAAGLLVALAREGTSRLLYAAKILEELGHPVDAERLYRQVLESAGKEQPRIVLELVALLSRRGRIEEALDLLDAKARGTLAAPVVCNAAVVVLYGAGGGETRLHERVARLIEKAIQVEPENVTLRFDLANLRCLQGRYDDAENIFLDLSAKEKTRSQPLNNLAWLLALRGDGRANRAIPFLEKAIEIQGETPDVLDTRALVYLATNQPSLAIRDLEDAIVISPSADKYFHLARAYLMANRRTDAADAFTKAKELGLRIASLHPLERGGFQNLTAELAAR